MENEVTTIKKPELPEVADNNRAIAEVQGAVMMAKQFPRDEIAVYDKILTACRREGLANSATYSYPRGGQIVKGPSIRLAETIARYWGNMQFGIKEIENNSKDGYSVVQAYAWDVETNTRQEKTFTVKHTISTKKGDKRLTDPRDIYEHTASQGARRLRACILGVVPADIIEDAVEQCHKTAVEGAGEVLGDRARKAVLVFKDFGVTQDMMERRLGHDIDAITPEELIDLETIYKTIKDGMSAASNFFDMPRRPKEDKAATDINEQLNEELNEKVEAGTQVEDGDEKGDKETTTPEGDTEKAGEGRTDAEEDRGSTTSGVAGESDSGTEEPDQFFKIVGEGTGKEFEDCTSAALFLEGELGKLEEQTAKDSMIKDNLLFINYLVTNDYLDLINRIYVAAGKETN